LIGRVFIGAAGAGAGYLIINDEHYFEYNLYSTVIPIVVFFVISFVIGSIFMGIFSMASDTIMMCILVDKETNNGSAKSVPVHL